MQFAKKNHGSVNSMITWLLGKAIRNIHAEALQEEFANEVIRENITAQCNPKVLIPGLAGVTWLDRYLEQLPNLEAKKQLCRKVIEMQRSTANISYTGKFEWG